MEKELKRGTKENTKIREKMIIKVLSFISCFRVKSEN